MQLAIDNHVKGYHLSFYSIFGIHVRSTHFAVPLLRMAVSGVF